jgi:hypothetical protein
MPSREQVYGINITKPYEVCITLIDTEREEKYELGRSYEFPPLDFGECNVNQKFQDSIGVNPGDIIYYEIPFTYNMNNILVKYDKYARENGKKRTVYRSNWS